MQEQDKGPDKVEVRIWIQRGLSDYISDRARRKDVEFGVIAGELLLTGAECQRLHLKES